MWLGIVIVVRWSCGQILTFSLLLAKAGGAFRLGHEKGFDVRTDRWKRGPRLFFWL